MQISTQRNLRRLTLCACAIAAVVAPAAQARVQADLRVEANGRPVVRDNTYLTGDETVLTDTSKPACNGKGQNVSVPGPSALGTLITASRSTGAVRPLRVSDQFDFGLLVCGIGPELASDSDFWLYKVDHVSPEVGADAFKLTGGEEVFWYFVHSDRGANTGDELDVDVPARARRGAGVPVTVSAYAANGTRRPAARARVFFTGGSVLTDNNGQAFITPTGHGTGFVRASRGSDIPSKPLTLCVADDLNRCAVARGKRLIGSEDGELIKGSGGADTIESKGGNDRVDLRAGSRDKVRCGRGRDRVRMDRGDSAGGDCEVVIVNGKRRSNG